MSEGVIYVVTQNPRYLDLLLASLESLKSEMPGIPVTVFSQFPFENPLCERVIRTTGSADGFYDKARLMLESPYERTTFVDADVYVAQPFPELFRLLDYFDCAAAQEEYLNTDWQNAYARPDIPVSFPEFNTGVLAYRRSDRMDKTLAEWSTLYQRFLKDFPGQAINDQPFFRAAAYFSDVRIATLGREYNCKFRGQGYLNGPVKLLHGHVNFKMKSDYMRRVLKVMNASIRPRVYIAGKVYEQHISGRLWGRRKARRVGSFSEPESLTVLRVRKLRELLTRHSFIHLISKELSWKSRQKNVKFLET